MSTREERQAERKRRLNQRGESPPAWKEDPFLASAGDGPGVYGEYGDEDQHDD